MLPALTQVTPCRTEQEQRLRSLWEAVGESDANILELAIMVKTSNPTTFSRLTLKDVRVVPGFGLNLLSAPRMEKAGWYLSQGGGQFKAMDSEGRVVFTVGADFKGLYFFQECDDFQSNYSWYNGSGLRSRSAEISLG